MIKRGGKRAGAGRPKGGGKYSCATKPIRVPVDMIEQIEGFILGESFELPLYSSLVSAGFPTAGDDHSDSKLDLNKYLIQRPASTFFVRVSGDSMIGAGIQAGDILRMRSFSGVHTGTVLKIDGSRAWLVEGGLEDEVEHLQMIRKVEHSISSIRGRLLSILRVPELPWIDDAA